MIQKITANLPLTLIVDLLKVNKNDLFLNPEGNTYYLTRPLKSLRVCEDSEPYDKAVESESGTWDFVERYYPDYYICSEIMRNDDLCKIVNHELEGNAAKVFEMEYRGNYQQALASYNQSTKYILERAILAFQKIQQDCIAIIWTVEDVMERARVGGRVIGISDALALLHSLKEKHDCNVGVSWDTIDECLSFIVPESGGYDNEP